MAGRKRLRYGRGREAVTIEERVWRWLRKQKEPVKAPSVREHFKLSRASTSHCLKRLTEKTSVIRTGVNHATAYQATEHPPFDLRGTAPGSIRVCRQNRAPLFGSQHP